MSPRVVLAADRLTRVFPAAQRGGPGRLAVSDVSFTLAEHEILGVVGANAAGKTTLIDLLAGVLAPTSGTVRLSGTVGYVPSGGRALYPRLTARHNLEFFAALHGFCSADARARVDAVLHLVGGTEASAVRVDRLSDGMIARVALARALLHDPAILLLDEPARSVDPVHRPHVLRTIREHVRHPGKAAVMVTHDTGDLFEICDRVGVMQSGRMLQIEDVGVRLHDEARLRGFLRQEPGR
jgi:ABC-2 type transport system ATP-binding protein